MRGCGTVRRQYRRRKTRAIAILALALAGTSGCSLAARAVAPTEIELEEAARWAAAKFQAVTITAKPAPGLHVLANNDPVRPNARAGKPLSTDPPFAFTYDGKRSADLFPAWTAVRSSRELDERRVEHTVVYSDKGTGLEVRCIAVEHRDFPTIEWTVHFKNRGQAETPILSDILALDLGLERSDRGEYVLHHFRGNPCLASDFEPFETVLQPGTVKRITAAGGRPTNSDMPFLL